MSLYHRYKENLQVYWLCLLHTTLFFYGRNTMWLYHTCRMEWEECQHLVRHQSRWDLYLTSWVFVGESFRLWYPIRIQLLSCNVSRIYAISENSPNRSENRKFWERTGKINEKSWILSKKGFYWSKLQIHIFFIITKRM